MDFSLSTSWNASNYTGARLMLFEIKKAGFDKVELSFNLTSEMVSEIIGFVRKEQIKVSSIHNYCPIPPNLERKVALPDCYSMASLNEKERKLAIKYTKRTIDTAKALNAKAVVLHTGRVEIPDRTRELINLYEKGKKKSAEFKLLRKKIIKERAKFAKPFFKNTLKSLEEINHHAQKKGIMLGVENRFYYREIPTFKEVGIILKRFKKSNIFYWHDTGHAQVMGNLGLEATHKQFLKAYGKKILGFHLHNANGCDDHQAPAKGDIDFRIFKPYIKKNTLLVIEAHQPATAKELKKSITSLRAIFREAI